MNREEFKKNENDNIDLSSDKFYNKIIKLISNNKFKLITMGSYIKYGKDKACDLDFIRNVYDDKRSVIKEYIERFTYLNNRYKNKLFITKIKFDIEDKNIKSIMDTMGYIDIHMNVKNYQLKIPDEVPTDIKNKVKIFATKYENNKTLESYIELFMYLKSNLSPSWTIDELKEGVKEFHGVNYDIYEMLDRGEITSLMTEMIYKKFQVSYKIWFGGKPIMDRNMYPVKLNGIIHGNMIDYYKLLKKLYTFLKWAYYNKMKDYNMKAMAIKSYNMIYDFRESVGTINSKLCKYSTYQEIVTNPDKIKLINKKVDKYYNILNNSSKKIFMEESKKYNDILEQYFRIQPSS
jgi:hypothetical protein